MEGGLLGDGGRRPMAALRGSRTSSSMRSWAMNYTIWRSMSMSAPFSASSVNAIVATVIVESLGIKVDGSHLNLNPDQDEHP